MQTPTLRRFSIGRKRATVAAAAVLLLFTAACDGGCGSKTGADGAAAVKAALNPKVGRIQTMAAHLGEDTQLSFIVGDLDQMRDSLNKTRETLGTAMPMTDLIEQQVKNELGLDIFDAKSWENSGIDPKGALSISVVGTRPVMLTYIDDKQKFEKGFVDQLKQSMKIEGLPKSVTAAGVKMKVVGEGEQSVAWAYDDKLVAVVFPDADEIKDFAAAEVISSADLTAKIVKKGFEKSLADHKGFKRFQDALANDQAMALYINPKTVFNAPNFDAMSQGDANTKAAVGWAEKNIDAFGFALTVEGNSMGIRAWAALPESGVAKAKAIMTSPAKFPIAHFATENTLIGLRQSMDMQEFWKFYTEDILDAEQRAELDEQTAKMSSTSDFDLQKDLIANLTGNFAVILYGVDPNAVQTSGGDMVNAVMGAPLQTLAILAPIQFKDKAGADKVVDYMMNEAINLEIARMEAAGLEGADLEAAKLKAATIATRTPVRDGVDVIAVEGMGATAGRFFVKDTLFVYATSPINDDSVVDYIAGKRDEKTLGTNKALDLGKSLATDDFYTGLYLNFVRAQEHLLPQLGMVAPMVEPFLIKLEEASLTTELGKDGAFVNLTIDLNPDAPKPATIEEPSK